MSQQEPSQVIEEAEKTQSVDKSQLMVEKSQLKEDDVVNPVDISNNNEEKVKLFPQYEDDYPQSVHEDPIYVDDAQVFMTQQKQEVYLWKCFDFVFPAGKLAKLVKISDFSQKLFPFSEILSKLKLDDGYPVVNFIGARHNFEAKKEDQRGKFYAGIARACFNTDAIIVDNAVTTGVEKFALRRQLKIIGVAPEGEIQYPKLNPTSQNKNELSNGHSHMFLLNNLDKNLKWGGESAFKLQMCKKIAEGKMSKTQGRPRCKIINILFLDDIECFDEIREAVLNKLPIIIVKGSRLCDRYIEQKKIEEQQKIDEQNRIDEQNKPKDPLQPDSQDQLESKISPKVVPKQSQKKEIQKQPAPYDDPKYEDAEFDDIINDPDAHVYALDSLNSEEIAQFVHFFLTYTPY